MPLESAVTDAARAEAEQHILDHSLGEAARIARLSRVREFVLGAQDGLLVPLGVVTGMAAANPSRSLIIIAGLAEAVAGAVAMGSGSYLASEAEERLYVSEIEEEGREIVEFPERETAELAVVLENEGLPARAGRDGRRGLAANPNVFLRTKVEKELGLSPDAGGAALGDALVVGLTYLGAAVVPLWPYLVFPIRTALIVSLVCTLAALFALGVAKGRSRICRSSIRPAGGDHRLGQRRDRLRDRPPRQLDRRLSCPSQRFGRRAGGWRWSASGVSSGTRLAVWSRLSSRSSLLHW